MAVLALCIYFQRQRPSRHALLAIVCYGLSVFLFNVWVFSDDLDYAYKLFNAGINGSLVVYLGALFYFLLDPPRIDDLLTRLLWGCVLIAELWGLVFQNIGCNLIAETATRAEIAETWGIGGSKYVCGREIGEWFEFTPLLVEIGFMAWIIHRWVWVRNVLRDN
ncbi:MAG: hypothetical protein ACR2RF_25410 [Geminicoccaceae bacterium]